MMKRQSRPGSGAAIALVLAAVLTAPVPRAVQGQGITREAVLRAEDARARGPGELAILIAASRNPGLRALGIRALGRLERPELADSILPFLEDSATTAVAAEALAQSLRGLPAAESRTRDDIDRLTRVRAALMRLATRPDGDPVGRGAVARSLARLPHATPAEAREVESVIVKVRSPVNLQWRELSLVEDIAAALHTIARARRTLGDPSAEAIAWLRQAAVVYRVPPVGPPKVAPVRRLAWLALNAARAADTAMIRTAIADRDAQVRRQAVLALSDVVDTAFRRSILDTARRDAEPMVRLDWIAGHRLLSPDECGPLLQSTHDPDPHVMLAAIDALGATCGDRGPVVSRLRQLIAEGPTGPVTRTAGRVSWHGLAHALLAMSRVDPDSARVILLAHAGHPTWQVRMYAARGAVLLRDTVVLNRLAFDSVGNVREVAIGGLSSVVGHLADRIYIRALSSPDYHVVRAAARALRGAPLPDSVLPAVVEAFDRLSDRGEQTSRDPRMELLARIDEMGNRGVAAVLARRGNDADERIAMESARIARKFDSTVEIRVQPRMQPEPIASFVDDVVKLRVTMSESSGGGSFEVFLASGTAPITSSRVVALVRSGYYDGLTFHRVVPNFVLQGGSPAMNEYVGIGPFMRDELGLGHHARGWVGISTRGRDTGDAQWFINLVDNYRLDHEYTVFGLVEPVFLDVIDGILEGDVIESVRVIR